MLDKKHRIRTKAEYAAVFGSGQKIKAPFCHLCYRPTTEAIGRVGVIVSKKNIPLSVRRNLLKRIVREAARVACESITGVDVVILVHRQARECSRKEFRECLDNLFERLSGRLR